MNFKNFIFSILFLYVSISYAQQTKKHKLFSVANTAVYSDEFLRVFNKNRDIVAEENKKSVEEYLDLYINYKLKLKQAYDLKYDTVSSYKKELAKYREQLIIPYLSDGEVTSALVKEAYDRKKKEVKASHILVQLPANPRPEDTIKAYHRIIDARNRILKGDAFEIVARKYSQDPSAQQNGGDLGYFTAFSMVYPFENAAYTTKIGEVSMPFRTRFGYHIVKVNDIRDSQGEVMVAHIMIREHSKDSVYAKTKINELYAKIQQGENFEFIAKRHSEDRSSAINGGMLPKFNRSRMVQSFADVAFSMSKPNEISKPFQTPYGWHIIKFIKKIPLQSFEEMQKELKQKIAKSPRAALAGKSIINKLKKKYSIDVDTSLLQVFTTNDTQEISKNLDKTIFSINGTVTKLKELAKVSQKGKSPLKETYDKFFEAKILQYYKNNLEKTNQEFAFTMQEYKDGLLLFNILQDKVWKRAEKDSLGLQSFFKKHRENYKWKKRGDVIVASCTKNEKAYLVKKYLDEGKRKDEIKKLVNEGATVHVIFTHGILEEGNQKLPKDFQFEKIGVTDVIPIGENDFVVLKINDILPLALMNIDETRGKVVNDYQEFLEQNWIKELKRKYPVKVQKRTLKKLIKQHK